MSCTSIPSCKIALILEFSEYFFCIVKFYCTYVTYAFTFPWFQLLNVAFYCVQSELFEDLNVSKSCIISPQHLEICKKVFIQKIVRRIFDKNRNSTHFIFINFFCARLFQIIFTTTQIQIQNLHISQMVILLTFFHVDILLFLHIHSVIKFDNIHDFYKSFQASWAYFQF